MKTLKIYFIIGSLIILAACKSNPHTTSGDSSGTGAGGARVPGTVSKDTTAADSANRNKTDTVKKP